MDLSKIYRALGNKFPENMHGSIAVKLAHAGVEGDSSLWFGSRLLLIVLFSLVGSVGYLNFDRHGYLPAVALFLALFFLLSFIVYINIFFIINARANKVEKALPDFLMLIVSNLRAGMTPFSAFVNAARPEFGPLYEEVEYAAKKVGGKRTIDTAFIELSNKFNSELFKKTVDLFLKGLKSGGQLAKLLTANSEEIRRIQDLRAELIASTKTYTIFLAFIVVVVMPFLLGVSSNFLLTFIDIQSQIGSAATQSLPIFTGKVSITPQEMQNIAVAALLITSLLASFFMGIVSSGKPLYGLKYYPFLVLASLAFFFVTKSIIGQLVKLGA